MSDFSCRLLLVHAHPDDETIGTGATMSRYAAAGAQVTLVICTQGEQGEILRPELEHLAADRDDALGSHRVEELATAMTELGVTDVRFLGGAGRYRDSGMVWGDEGRHAVVPERVRPDSFWAADLRDAADHLVPIIRETRPQVTVTYDDNGGYGHPDHIQAHRVATYAIALAAVASYRPDLGAAWSVSKVYWSAIPRDVLQRVIDVMREQGTGFDGVESADDLGFAVDSSQLTTAVDGSAFLSAKLAAMRAHASQIDLDGPFFALADHEVGRQLWGTEFYRLAQGVLGPVDPETGYESDLFAGLSS